MKLGLHLDETGALAKAPSITSLPPSGYAHESKQ